MDKRRIVLVDDHEIVRTGLKQLLALEPDLEVTGEAGTSADVLTLLRQTACDVLLLDVALPDRNGVDTLKLIRGAYPDLPVLVVSTYPEEQYAINLLRGVIPWENADESQTIAEPWAAVLFAAGLVHARWGSHEERRRFSRAGRQ